MALRPTRVPLDPAQARERALRLLSRREHGARELKSKLQQRGADADVAAAAVEGLAERGLQSDARYAAAMVRHRAAQGHGPLRVRAELRAERIADEVIREVLDQADIDWHQQACDLQARKFGAPPVGMEETQRQYRYLAGRGFEAEQIREALRREGA